ncbi:MAG: alcohol dehydrogenase family protein [Rhodospirillales bacterium]|nr:alcohol dehydrogenase family protein [Rhodospirillales bacterium]
MEVPRIMKAVLLTGHGGLDKLELRDDVAVPRPGPGEVLIEVGACGMNNTDINTRAGWYSKAVTEGTTAEGGATGFASVAEGESDGGWGSTIRFPRIQGADVCGRVVALGEGAPAGLDGKRVLIDTWLRDWDDPLNMDKCRYFGSEADGGYAEYSVAPARNVHAIESDLSDAELATFATSYITAENMLRRAAVEAGEVVLIPGASGGVGSALIQLARRRGAIPVALCSAPKAEAVKAIGAEAVLEREPADLTAALEAAIGRDEVDVVADVVGGPLWPQLIEVLRRGGRYTCAGAIAGPIVAFDLRTFYLNDLTFTGATIIPPDLFADLVGYIERGEIRPLLAATYPLEKIREAQQAFLAKKHVGNIVMVPPQAGR